MARVELTVTLASFERVVARMRQLGVASWVGSPVGDVVLGAPPATETEKAKPDPKSDRRAYYSEVFGRNVTDSELKNLP